MDESRRTHLITLRDINQTRLKQLELQQARLGINSPPEIQTEIEEIKKVVQQLDGDIDNDPRTAGSVFERFKIFVSSSVKDKEVTDIISQTISRITLGQIEVMSFKSGTTSGEITPFNIWFDEMRSRSNQIRTLVILLTPASITESSIYFESGIVASRSDCNIMPVCIGVDCSHEVPFPLSMYQRYQLSDYTSFENFAKNLLHPYNQWC